MRVAVVGGGFWGTAIALALAEREVEVRLYDDGRDGGASRAAAGLVQKSWYKPGSMTSMRLPEWWTEVHARAGWALLVERCGLDSVGEWFSTPANFTGSDV